MATIQILNAPRATHRDDKQKPKREFKLDKNKIRLLAGLGVLLVLIGGILWWRGMFTPADSDEGQIRRLTMLFKDRVNAHNWRGVCELCNLTQQRADQWVKSVEVGPANALVVDDVQLPAGFTVATGATELELPVTVFARLQAGPFSITDSRPRTGTVYYVKVAGRWYVDVERSAPAFSIPVPR